MCERVAAAPLPAEECARGHVVTAEMWAQIDRFMEDTILLGARMQMWMWMSDADVD